MGHSISWKVGLTKEWSATIYHGFHIQLLKPIWNIVHSYVQSSCLHNELVASPLMQSTLDQHQMTNPFTFGYSFAQQPQ